MELGGKTAPKICQTYAHNPQFFGSQRIVVSVTFMVDRQLRESKGAALHERVGGFHTESRRKEVGEEGVARARNPGAVEEARRTIGGRIRGGLERLRVFGLRDRAVGKEELVKRRLKILDKRSLDAKTLKTEELGSEKEP